MLYLATTYTTTPNTNQYMNLGVKHHLTLDINILDTITPFSGSDQVTVGNNKQISISHLGTATLPSSYSPLILHQVYHTPKISNNLISITKFCFDNKVFVEIYATHFLVKEQVSRGFSFKDNLIMACAKFSHQTILLLFPLFPKFSQPTSRIQISGTRNQATQLYLQLIKSQILVILLEHRKFILIFVIFVNQQRTIGPIFLCLYLLQ